MLVAPVALYQAMFVVSGAKKIASFDAKVATLCDKIRERTSVTVPRAVASAGMVGAIVLEIVGSLVLIYAASTARRRSSTWRFVATSIIGMFIVFVVVATLLYHFPSRTRMIPALSNLTTAAGFVLMWFALYPASGR